MKDAREVRHILSRVPLLEPSSVSSAILNARPSEQSGGRHKVSFTCRMEKICYKLKKKKDGLVFSTSGKMRLLQKSLKNLTEFWSLVMYNTD